MSHKKTGARSAAKTHQLVCVIALAIKSPSQKTVEKGNQNKMLIQLLNTIFRGEILKNSFIYSFSSVINICRVYFLFKLYYVPVFSQHTCI